MLSNSPSVTALAFPNVPTNLATTSTKIEIDWHEFRQVSKLLTNKGRIVLK